MLSTIRLGSRRCWVWTPGESAPWSEGRNQDLSGAVRVHRGGGRCLARLCWARESGEDVLVAGVHEVPCHGMDVKAYAS
jgi:hypothetical protein